MTTFLRPFVLVSIASASLFLAHCGGDDVDQNPEPDAAADGSVDGRAPNDATVPKDATPDTTVDANDASNANDASDATTPDANAPDANTPDAGDANDAEKKDAASDTGDGDAKSGDANDGATLDASGDDASDGDVPDAPIDTGCGPVRTLNPIEAGTGPTCPFALDGGPVTCAFGETCCEPATATSSGTSVCAATCPAKDGGTVWECQDPGSCPTGDVCCAQATSVGQDPGCATHFLSRFRGTTCRTSCQAGEIIVCESQTQCPNDGTGLTCEVAAGKGLAFGLCIQ